ncbi:MAG: 4Fe-4S dicluster domain-containing protein [Candidatus Schekmanbacteria bacterium]|nr:MAG: 4Fe-4S dicluster domain-containing protein [Candidatus Schekmanbacteria bacterium]
MEWDKEALDFFDNNVIAGPPQLELRKIYTEKIARQRKKSKVTKEDVEQCIKDYEEFFGKDFTQKLCSCMAKGEMPEVPPTQKEGVPCLYQIETCHSKYFGCPSQIIDVKELVYPLIDKLEESKITEILADKSHGPLLSHNKFTISISSCANVCTGAESKDFGVWGVEKPKVNDDVECIDCKQCMHACWDSAVYFEEAKKPQINEVLCKLCGACIKACPTGTISSEKIGYRILVGGTFGRMQTIGKEIFKMGSKEDIFKTLDAVIEMIKEKQDKEHFLAQVLQKAGIEYITSRVF